MRTLPCQPQKTESARPEMTQAMMDEMQLEMRREGTSYGAEFEKVLRGEKSKWLDPEGLGFTVTKA